MQSSGLNHLISGNCGLRHTIWISWTPILIWSKIACLKHFKPFKALLQHQHEIKICTVQKKYKKFSKLNVTHISSYQSFQHSLNWTFVPFTLLLHNTIWDILFTLLHDSSDSLWRSQRSACWHFDRGLQRGYCFFIWLFRGLNYVIVFGWKEH